jgi:hypothetical protein
MRTASPTSSSGRPRTAILYRGGPTGPSVVPNGLSRLVGARIVAFSDHDGDGRSDFVGMDPSTSPASISWAGSDGTTNPRSFIVRLPTGAMFIQPGGALTLASMH